MSEERRKKQQSPEGLLSGNRRPYLVRGGVVVVVAAVIFAFWYHNNHRYDDFAKCLAAKQAKMYGLYWCPHCIEQKEKFGESFHYVNYVECGVKGSSEMTPECKVAGIKLFPSWQFGMETPKEGILSLEALSDKTGCSLP